MKFHELQRRIEALETDSTNLAVHVLNRRGRGFVARAVADTISYDEAVGVLAEGFSTDPERIDKIVDNLQHPASPKMPHTDATTRALAKLLVDLDRDDDPDHGYRRQLIASANEPPGSPGRGFAIVCLASLEVAEHDIRARLEDAPPSYVSRALAHRGEDLQRRIAVVLRGEHPLDWIEALRERAQVFRDQTVREALRNAGELGASAPAARITGAVSPEELAALAREADGDSVSFADPALELEWTRRVLGFGDAR